MGPDDQKQTMPRSQLPTFVIPATIILIPISVAIVNFGMVSADLQLLQWKFASMQNVTSTSGLAAGVAVLVSVSALYSFVASSLVNYVAPICAGSGIPEVLAFLNGNTMQGIFTLPSFIVRTSAMVLAQTAGFPLGREGPMVAIGGSVGFGVVHLLLRREEMKVDRVLASSGTCPNVGTGTTLAVTEELFANAKRMGCALGGAAGIATAFNAPIGGILYMFEELAVSSLPPDLAKFMCTIFASLAMKALLHLSHMDVHALVIYDEDPRSSDSGWDWIDVPPMMLLAALLGCVGALFSKLLRTSWSFRRNMATKLYRQQRWAKVLDCVVYCMMCALCWGLAPRLFECQSVPESAGHADDTHRRLSGGLNYVQYSCPSGYYNELASYLLDGAEGFVKHLYSRGDSQRSGPLFAALLLYFPLACGMPGLPVPMGTFVPSMVIGALAGRLFGENLTSFMAYVGGPQVAVPGAYAIVGSGAVLAGLTHMTVGIVALLAEAVGDFKVVAPLMLSVFMAQTTSKLISHLGYDEYLIIMKGVPFLDPEVPHEMISAGFTAADLVVELPSAALLPPKASLGTIKRALKQRKIVYYPIIDEGNICIGITTRGRLKAVLEAVSNHPDRLSQRRSSITSNVSEASGVSSSDGEELGVEQPRLSRERLARRPTLGHLHDPQAEAKLKDLIRSMFANVKQQSEEFGDSEGDCQDLLPLTTVMDSAPHALQQDMPVYRFYDIFNKTSANVAIVVSKHGHFRGILTRQDLAETQARLHATGHQKLQQREQQMVPGQTSKGTEWTSMGSSNVGSYSIEESVGEVELALSADPHEIVQPDCGTSSWSNQVASGVVANMSPEDMQAELIKAWRRTSADELAQDKLQERIRELEQQNRDLELRLGSVTNESRIQT